MSSVHKLEIKNIENNIYYKHNQQYFIDLVNLITEFPMKYGRKLKSCGRKREIKMGIKCEPYKYLYDWINAELPILNSTEYNINTKCFWILNNITQFPKCKNPKCHKTFEHKNICSIYYGYAHQYCSRKCLQNDKNTINKRKYTNLKKYGVVSTFNTEKSNIARSALAKKHNTDYKYWNNPKKATETKRKIYGKDCLDRKKYKNTCLKKYGAEHNMQSENGLKEYSESIYKKYGVNYTFQSNLIKQKSKETSLQRYGVKHPMQCYSVQLKRFHKYIFNNLKFDSIPEIAFYIWLKEHNINFEYQPNIYFQYEYLGITHYYYPDFKIGNKLIELKGDHFFDNNEKMICPYRKNIWTDDEYNKICNLYEAKHQCMLKNNIIIYKSNKYSKYVNYIYTKYGKNYLKQFEIK